MQMQIAKSHARDVPEAAFKSQLCWCKSCGEDMGAHKKKLIFRLEVINRGASADGKVTPK
jgi:hypothetical protein